MLIKFFRKLGTSRWLPWVGTAPFLLMPVAIMFGGEVSKGLGYLAVFASIWVGITLGAKVAQIVSTRIFKVSEDVAERLTAAFCAFGFLFVPVLVGSFTNANLGTEIGMHSLRAHFIWACVGAGIVFWVIPEDPKASS
jgi:hypothetical protein